MNPLSLMDFDYFSITRIKRLKKKDRITINTKYQRSFIWKKYQKQDLIESILQNFPIGALVLLKKGGDSYDIIDGQQRFKTIVGFIDGDIETNQGEKFSNIGDNKRSAFYAYKIPCLQLKQGLSGNQVSDIFIRLQEGTTLSVGEKLYAFTGNFRTTFVNSFFAPENNQFFERIKDHRFKARFLAAALLALELKVKFSKKDFPNLKYLHFKKINSEYKTEKIPQAVLKRYNKNLQFLGKYMYGMLGRLKPQQIIPPYMLQSYFNQSKINEPHQGIIFKNFLLDFFYDLEKIKIANPKKPRDMSKGAFDRLYQYKVFTRKGITSESFFKRFKILKKEYQSRVGQIKLKDKHRFYTQEQKISLYFLQKGICPICKKDILYRDVEADHIQKHETGGKTEVDNGRLIHNKCHKKIHEQENKK